MRVLQIDLPPAATAWKQGRNVMDVKRVGAGLLVQTADNHELAVGDLKVVSKLQPTAKQLRRPAVRVEGREVRQVATPSCSAPTA